MLLHIFQKNLTNHALIFCAFGRKTQIVGKFWENFENFWWKFYRKLDFYLIFIFICQKFVSTNRAFGNPPFFYSNFFCFAGISPSPRLRPWTIFDILPNVLRGTFYLTDLVIYDVSTVDEQNFLNFPRLVQFFNEKLIGPMKWLDKQNLEKVEKMESELWIFIRCSMGFSIYCAHLSLLSGPLSRSLFPLL